MEDERGETDAGQDSEAQEHKGAEGDGRRKKDRRRRTHDPIIVDASSFNFGFDGGTTAHYVDLTVGNNARFFGPGLRVTRVGVIGKSDCPLPVSRLFRVEVQGLLNGRREVSFTVNSVLSVVEVSFKISRFGKPSHSGHRKTCKHRDLKVTGLTITDISGLEPPHACPDIPRDGAFRIEIIDDHV